MMATPKKPTTKRDRSGRGPARKGKPPLPTPLRVLDGSASPDDVERQPKPESKALPRKPAWLVGEGAKLWAKLARSLHRKGLLDQWNADLFAVWCNEVGDYVEATRQVARDGLIVEGHHNVQRKHPALSVQRDAVPAIRLLGAEFGLTPAARAGLDLVGELPLDAEVRALLSG
jgi:P27 family predicted phage terminase small subunit